MPAKEKIYQLKISLDRSEPEIWRRVLVPGSFTLEDLHYIIQIVMGWEGGHMHEFEIKKQRYGSFMEDDDLLPVDSMFAPPALLPPNTPPVQFNLPPNQAGSMPPELQQLFESMSAFAPFGGFADDEMIDQQSVTLQDLLKRVQTKFSYTYDFGDNWQHTLVVEKMLDADPNATYPTCIEGEKAGPPDDSGGIWGYYAMLEILNDPKHPDHEFTKEWMGGAFDPEKFDQKEINKRLKRAFAKSKSQTKPKKAQTNQKTQQLDPIASLEVMAVQESVDIALDLFGFHDGLLLQMMVHDRTIAHKLATYLQQTLKIWDVDLEYNAYSPAIIQQLHQLAQKYLTQPFTDLLPIVANIVVHNRHTNQCLLAVDINRSVAGATIDEFHRQKLAFYKQKLNCKYTAYIRFATASGEDVVEFN